MTLCLFSGLQVHGRGVSVRLSSMHESVGWTQVFSVSGATHRDPSHVAGTEVCI